MTQCPQCGYDAEASPYVMTEMERLIIETLRDVRKSPLSPVSSQLLADVLGYSPNWIARNLINMRRHGLVSLPLGRCSGWIEGDVLRELSHIIAGCNNISGKQKG